MIEDEDDLKAKRLCYACVGESYLKAEIHSQGLIDTCSYCGGHAETYGIGSIAQRIDEVFKEHFFRTSDQPDSYQQSMLSDRESTYNWERSGEEATDAIMNAADMPEEAAADVQRILGDQYDDFDLAAMHEETEYSADAYYEEKGTDDRAWQEEWHSFERSLKTEARFFSRTAVTHLTTIFEGIESMSARDRRPLVVDAGPGTPLSAIYRARVFQSDDKLGAALGYPDIHLGSPPANFASAGRMNARGISVFYGASDPLVALAEVRPPVGSRVAVARFEITRPLRLLDLTALTDIHVSGSIFDAKFGHVLEQAMFLRSLSQRITRPVMPDDEAMDFLITQAIADFLATGSSSALDGIIYPSVQAAGDASNVVLFHKAARVAPINLPHGTQVNATTGFATEDGWEVDYSVTEAVPPAAKLGTSDDSLPVTWELPLFPVPNEFVPFSLDHRRAALRIVPESIEIHSVLSVKFTTETSAVRRHRHEHRDRKL
jgi:hypothetical protein